MNLTDSKADSRIDNARYMTIVGDLNTEPCQMLRDHTHGGSSLLRDSLCISIYTIDLANVKLS